jgi:hypothetical protein
MALLLIELDRDCTSHYHPVELREHFPQRLLLPLVLPLVLSVR